MRYDGTPLLPLTPSSALGAENRAVYAGWLGLSDRDLDDLARRRDLIYRTSGVRMPLPANIERKELHRRSIEVRGYARDDGLYEIEAHLVDTKAYTWHRDDGKTLPPGAPVHDMWIRLTVDESLEVRDVIACIDAAPHEVCPEAAAALSRLKGLRIASGWTMKVKELLGGARGCTHLAELLGPAATAAYQTLAPIRHSRPDVRDGAGKPVKIDSCFAYASSREVVRRRWPEFYTGNDAGLD